MQSDKFFCYICLLLCFLVSACQNDSDKKNDYSGVSNLISDRNKGRYEAAEKNPVKNVRPKPVEEHINPLKPESDSTNEEVLPVLYEEKVDIVGSESHQTIAKGVAYINKNGQIVRIKIIKE